MTILSFPFSISRSGCSPQKVWFSLPTRGRPALTQTSQPIHQMHEYISNGMVADAPPMRNNLEGGSRASKDPTRKKGGFIRVTMRTAPTHSRQTSILRREIKDGEREVGIHSCPYGWCDNASVFTLRGKWPKRRHRTFGGKKFVNRRLHD